MQRIHVSATYIILTLLAAAPSASPVLAQETGSVPDQDEEYQSAQRWFDKNSQEAARMELAKRRAAAGQSRQLEEKIRNSVRAWNSLAEEYAQPAPSTCFARPTTPGPRGLGHPREMKMGAIVAKQS